MAAAADRLCPACSAWHCAAADAYCGRCGRPCAQLALEALPSVLPLGHQIPRLALTLVNPTCAPVHVARIAGPDWLDATLPPDTTIAPGGRKVFAARPRTSALRQPESSELRAVTSIGDAVALLMVIPETPALGTTPPALEYWPEKRRGIRSYTVSVAPVSGHLRVRGLVAPREPWLSVATTLGSPVIVGSERPLSLTVGLDPDRLPKAGATVKTLRGSVGVQYEGPHGTATTVADIAFDLRRSPEVAWIGEKMPPRVRRQAPRQIIGFTFKNALDGDALAGRQNGRLELSEVTLHPPDGFPGAQVQRLTRLPVAINGGDVTWIEFQVNCQSLDPRIHSFKLRAKTNRPEPDRTFSVPIEIRAIERFDGVLAIDFGTSNTCSALLPEGGEVLLVALDEKQTTAPTVVQYRDLSGPEPDIATGAFVKGLAAVDQDAACATVTQLKQRLGETRYQLRVKPLQAADWHMREAREAVADYLRHMRTVTEREHGYSFHEFILTHPAVCSLAQYRNLRRAIEDAFGKTARVHFLQEPMAALVPFFAGQAQGAQSDRREYVVGAFDLGGGTTDITVVRVRHARNAAGVLEIRPEIVASWGERFGGENLTDFLVAELKTRIREKLKHERPTYQLAEDGLRGAATRSVMQNDAALRGWADAFKASLSDGSGSGQVPAELSLTIVPEALDRFPENDRFEIPQLAGNLKDVFAQHLRQRIAALAGHLRDSVGPAPLDHIQLSGMTAFLPDVVDTVREFFPHTTIERAADPKECVVRGACLWRALSRGRQRRLVMSTGVQRTTSRIGLLDEDGIFSPIIELDQPIPDGGLVAASCAWDGAFPVVLHENLGADNVRARADGSANHRIARLDVWDLPDDRAVPADGGVLRLHLRTDFTLQVCAVYGEEEIELRPRSLSRGDR